jgi:hypothetical protein
MRVQKHIPAVYVHAKKEVAGLVNMAAFLRNFLSGCWYFTAKREQQTISV